MPVHFEYVVQSSDHILTLYPAKWVDIELGGLICDEE